GYADGNTVPWRHGPGNMSCCRVRGREDKIVTKKLECRYCARSRKVAPWLSCPLRGGRQRSSPACRSPSRPHRSGPEHERMETDTHGHVHQLPGCVRADNKMCNARLNLQCVPVVEQI